jgi:hypothetical protein
MFVSSGRGALQIMDFRGGAHLDLAVTPVGLTSQSDWLMN